MENGREQAGSRRANGRRFLRSVWSAGCNLFSFSCFSLSLRQVTQTPKKLSIRQLFAVALQMQMWLLFIEFLLSSSGRPVHLEREESSFGRNPEL